MGTIIIQGRVRYGSVGYKVLNYARFKSRFGDTTFSIKEYQSFSGGQYKPYDVQRAVDALVGNGHVKKVTADKYRYIESGVLGRLENAYRKTLWASHVGSSKTDIDPDLSESDLI